MGGRQKILRPPPVGGKSLVKKKKKPGPTPPPPSRNRKKFRKGGWLLLDRKNARRINVTQRWRAYPEVQGEGRGESSYRQKDAGGGFGNGGKDFRPGENLRQVHMANLMRT